MIFYRHIELNDFNKSLQMIAFTINDIGLHFFSRIFNSVFYSYIRENTNHRHCDSWRSECIHTIFINVYANFRCNLLCDLTHFGYCGAMQTMHIVMRSSEASWNQNSFEIFEFVIIPTNRIRVTQFSKFPNKNKNSTT